MRRPISAIGRRARHALAICAGTAALLSVAAGGASAQSAAPTQPSAGLDGIIVTGTRIANADAAAAPASIVTGQEIGRTKAITSADYLRRLPQAEPAGGLAAAPEAAYVGLRNLGPQRTLVLVNGQPYPIQAGGGLAGVDLGDIPLSMIDHVDLLPEGESSIYGAGAIGGVVNVVTKQHFNGVEIGASVGAGSGGRGLEYGAHSTMGADFPRGSILINVATDHEEGGAR